MCGQRFFKGIPAILGFGLMLSGCPSQPQLLLSSLLIEIPAGSAEASFEISNAGSGVLQWTAESL